MDRQLNEIGTIPVTTSIIESLYPELKSANKKKCIYNFCSNDLCSLFL